MEKSRDGSLPVILKKTLVSALSAIGINLNTIATKIDNINYLKDQAWRDAREYDSFADAIALVAGTLFISNQQNVTASITIPSTITLNFLQGGSLNISSGKTVTINGHVEAGLYQIFEGAGSVVFGTGVVKEIYLEWCGVKFDNSTENSVAIEKALTIADNSDTKIMLSSGICKTNKLTNFNNGMVIDGQGKTSSILKAYSDDHVIEITGKSLHTLTLKNFGIEGYGSGSGHGVYIHDNSFSPYRLDFDINIKNCGAKGLYITEHFSTALEKLFVSDCDDNAIEIAGGNTVDLKNCYVDDVPDGKCAYRIYGGRITMISCNGMDSTGSTIWGIFGQSVAEDGVNTYAFVTLIGCNVEAFTSIGIRCKTGSGLNFIGSRILAPGAGTVKAFLFDYIPDSSLGIIDGLSSIETSGAAWANGKAIHTNGGGSPFISYNSVATEFYRDDQALVYTMPYLKAVSPGYARFGLDVSESILHKTKIEFAPPTELTIATGVITVTQNYHRVDGEGDVADNLDTINGGVDGMPLTLQAENNGRVITIRDASVGGGNIETEGNVAIVLDSVLDKAYFIYDGTNSKWCEINRFTG